MSFEDLRLEKSLLDAVQSAGYDTPTPIQSKAIPPILEGRDVLGCAQTGTGKTAAFALPILQRLAENNANLRRGERRPVRSLILAPTRELALQIAESFETYGKYSKLRHTVVFGGVNKNPQIRALRAGVDILVATPGRLLDHLSDGATSLGNVEVLILDEADRMLDMGFLPDIRRILKQVPKRRQTLLFSATMPPEIRSLAGDILHRPTSVEVARVSAPAETIEHWAYHVEKRQKPLLLQSVLEHTPFSRALVFTRTKYGADKVVRHLTKAGVQAAAIHGNKSQNARTRALDGFKSGKTSVLVATDIAARGLDIDDVSHVINYDLTADPETYVHRIGRSGRAGATGTALSFVSSEDHDSLRAIEDLLRTRLQHAEDPPGYDATAVSVAVPAPAKAPKPARHASNKQPTGDARNRRRRRRRNSSSSSRSRPAEQARVA
jgi:ATP-dependent RNA helicase RhlE